METLHILAGKDTPEVYFGPDVDIFQIEGISLPSNPVKFYEPIFQWIHDYLYKSEISSKFYINIKLDYFNTTSMKLLAKFFRIIDNSPADDFVTINWYYDKDDLDMLETGQRFDQFVKLKFEFHTN